MVDSVAPRTLNQAGSDWMQVRRWRERQYSFGSPVSGHARRDEMRRRADVARGNLWLSTPFVANDDDSRTETRWRETLDRVAMIKPGFLTPLCFRRPSACRRVPRIRPSPARA